MTTINRSLHWTQRIALVRHNLHAASRSGDFSFFKSLHAQGFLEGSNHVATLSATLGDEADRVLAALDDLNAALAQVHEDAFKTLYENLKTRLAEEPERSESETRSSVYVDTTIQKQMADMAIDKMTNSAITLIQQQSTHVQETTANIWIVGTTMVADSMDICLRQMDALESNISDFIRLENSWATVKTSVGCAISALRGIYNFMDMSDTGSEPASRRGSFAATTGGVFRRLSNAFIPVPQQQLSRSSSFACKDASNHARSNSFNFEWRSPTYMRSSISSACPTSLPDQLPDMGPFQHTDLSPIPPTPAILDGEINPFDTSEMPPVPPVPRQILMDVVMN